MDQGDDVEMAPNAEASDARDPKLARAEAARKGAATRRKKKVLSVTPFGRFLLALEEAQHFSDQAKARAADSTRYGDYHDHSKYRRLNYQSSRWARKNDYRIKEAALASACTLADELKLTFGWQNDGTEHVPFVVYFDLPNIGQVSFHATRRGKGPDYLGKWDGLKDATHTRIGTAIEVQMDSGKPSTGGSTR